MRKASLPFSAISAAAHARIFSNRSRLRCWVGTRRANAGAPASAAFGPAFPLGIGPLTQKRLDVTNTRVYRIWQIRDILVLRSERIIHVRTSGPDHRRRGQDRAARQCAAKGERRPDAAAG